MLITDVSQTSIFVFFKHTYDFFDYSVINSQQIISKLNVFLIRLASARRMDFDFNCIKANVLYDTAM